MAYIEFSSFSVTNVLPVMMLFSFFFTYFDLLNKILVWFKIKKHYQYKYNKEGLQKSVKEFVHAFEKLKGELLVYHSEKIDGTIKFPKNGAEILEIQLVNQ